MTGFKQTGNLSSSFFFGGQSSGWPAATFQRIADEGYTKNPYVYAATRYVANGVAGIPWVLMRADANGDWVEVDMHPVAELMAAPNPRTGRNQFLESIVGYLFLAGNAYIQRVVISGDRSKELWLLRPDLVKPILDAKGAEVQGYELRSENGTLTEKVKPEDILWLKLFNPLGIQGLSPFSAAARSIDQSNESKRWNISLLRNSGKRSGIFEMEGKLGDAEFAQFKNRVQEESGPESAGKRMVLDSGMKFTPIDQSPNDMDWLAGQKMSACEVAICAGLSPELLGDSSQKTYSNYQEARKAAYEQTILPLVGYICDEFNRWLLTGKPEYFVPNTDDVAALQEDKSGVFTRLKDCRFLTVNEKREAVGYEAIDGGDILDVAPTPAPFGGGNEPLPFEKPKPEAEPEPESEELLEEELPAKGEKSFALDTEEKKAEHWKAVDRRRQGYDERVRAVCKKRLDSDVALMAAAFAKADSVEAGKKAIEAVQPEIVDEWTWTLRNIYQVVGKDFAEQVYANLKGMAPNEIKAAPIDRWAEGVQAWLARPGFMNKIVGITDTTRESIMAKIAEGVDAGESIFKIGKRIDDFKLDNRLNTNRSETIARTEVIGASNVGSLEAAKSIGLPMTKDWIATRDDRTRDDHLEADGQVVDLDGKFTVGGESLECPGDPDGSAGNNINCRCTLAYNVKKE